MKKFFLMAIAVIAPMKVCIAQNPTQEVQKLKYRIVDGITSDQRYPLSNLCDGDPATAWVYTELIDTEQHVNEIATRPNTEWTDERDGYTFKIATEPATYVTGIKIWTGYCKSEALYYANSRPLELFLVDGRYQYDGGEFIINNGYGMSEDGVVSTMRLKDVPQPQYINIDLVKKDVNVFLVKIWKGTTGNKYVDVCISEIEVYGIK